MDKDHLIISDPVYGFINIPRGVLSGVVEHSLFQRLGRIRQLGLTFFVYPGAQHTRKQHSLGAFHLMQAALAGLKEKGHSIEDVEAEAALAAILMHDLGHAPFSHALEGFFVHGMSHEEISLAMMEQMNREMNGDLSLAIHIFKGEYPKSFLRELICSQLDMDRLDYLCRDSFYTGVIEGNIGESRIISMLDMVNDKLVVRSKGIYSVENYLMARRLMYWQVYLHKTVVGTQFILWSVLNRARLLINKGLKIFATPSLYYFLSNDITREKFFSSEIPLAEYVNLDDSDILVSVKNWMRHPDRVLSILASSLIDRNLFKTEIYEGALPEGLIEDYRVQTMRRYGVSYDETIYFVAVKTIEKEMYTTSSAGINMLFPNGEIKDVSMVSNLVKNENKDLKDSKLYVFRPSFI